MLNLYFNVMSVVLLIFHVAYCTLVSGHLENVGQLGEGDGQEEYTNSTNHYEFKTGSVHSSLSKSKRSTQVDFRACCWQVQPKLVDGYYYKFHVPSNRTFLHDVDIVSAGYAYLLAIENALKKPHRYFDIDDFLDKSGIVFPPTLPLVCYDTGYSLYESPLFHYGREDILRNLNLALRTTDYVTPSGISYIPLISALKQLNTYASIYIGHRQNMYRDIGNLLLNLQQNEIETLKTQCLYSKYNKLTFLINGALGDNTTILAMSLGYSLEVFNEVVKLFIGDIVAYEIIRQACMALCIPPHPQITRDDWKPIADKLCAISIAIRQNWHETELQENILWWAADTNAPNYRKDGQSSVHTSLESLFEHRHRNVLWDKYYQHGFRVSSHAGWATNNPLIREMCKGRQNQKCIDKNGKVFIVNWKSLKPAELSASFEAQPHHIKFPKMTPPPSSYKFAALYAKVETNLKKLEKAVNYFRVNELEKSYYKNVSSLIHTFENSAGYTFYSETAGHFAKSLDVLNVFSQRFQPLISTLSEVAKRVGEGTDKVWLLIDRSFFEMDYYMADIEEHIMQMRLRLKEKYEPLLSSPVEDDLVKGFAFAKEFLFGSRLSEEKKKIKLAFEKYQSEARFYATPVILKEFIDKCGTLKSAIDTIPTGDKASYGMWKLGHRGPFYIHTFLLMPTYDIIYLTLYSMFCACQRYRWLAVRNLVRSESRMSTADIQLFIRSTQRDISDISKKLDELVEAISTYMYKADFYWLDRLRAEIFSEPEVAINNDNAERIANDLKALFPWNNFTVDLIMPYSPDRMILEKNEKIYYYKFLANPDYSIVLMQSDTKFTMVVNWVPDNRDSTQPGLDFGFSSSASTLCTAATQQITSDLTNYQNMKSLFVWRAMSDFGWHRSGNVRTHSIDTNDLMKQKPVTSRAYGGGSHAVKRTGRSCWYRSDNTFSYCGLLTCYAYDRVAIYTLGNFGGDY